MSSKRSQAPTPAGGEGALPLDTPFAVEPDRDDEIVGVDRTGAHAPLSDELTGGAVVIDGFEADIEASEELPAVLSSVADEFAFDDEPAATLGTGLGGEPDRTAAYDPPPELFADIPDPEAAPHPVPFHAKATSFTPLVLVERSGSSEAAASDERAGRMHEPAVIVEAPESREVALFDPEPDPEAPVVTRARAPEPAPVQVPSPTPAAAPAPKAAQRSKKNPEKPHRPPGPMHRPIVREPTPPPRAPGTCTSSSATCTPTRSPGDWPRGPETRCQGPKFPRPIRFLK